MSPAAAKNLTATSVGAKRQVVGKTAQIIYANFPRLNNSRDEDRKYFATFVSTIGLMGFLALLGINTLLAQDAFTLSNLKVEAKLVADQRDAINREIDAISAPSALANAATKLGMAPSETPIFLDLTQSAVGNE
jgi:hypothetical protein